MNLNEFKDYLKKNFHQTSSFFSGFALMMVDVITLMVCIMLGFFFVNLFAKGDINFRSFVSYIIFIPIFIAIYAWLGLYPGIMIPCAEQVKKFFIGSLFGFAAIIITITFDNITDRNTLTFVTQDSEEIELIVAFSLSFIFSVILMPAFREYSKVFFSKYRFYGVPAVIYCTGNSADHIIERLKAKKYLGYKPAVIIDAAAVEYYEKDGIPVFSPSETEIVALIHKFNIKNAFVCDYQADISPIMNTYRYTISVSKSQSNFTSTQQLKDISGIIGFASTHNLTFGFNLLLKRLLDIFIILFFSPVLIPVFLVLIILVKCTSKGPVFYGHERVGKNGKAFKCWKFRSMNINSQEMLKKILENDPVRRAEWEAERKFKDDPRVTKFGKFLRKTSLDELPQIFNVLIGNMSFVGPRPVTAPELEKYGNSKNIVLSVLPGLSGMWQISGRSETSYEERITYDTYYIQNWSIWLDLWILIKTVWVVLKRKGAY